MSKFLKGNYNIKKKIIDKKETKESIEEDFRKKAINSVGGSMVFVERNKLVWDGDEDEDNT